MKRVGALLLILCAVVISGCGAQKKYSVTWYDSFDTIISLTGYADSRADFDDIANRAHGELLRLHAIFDQYGEHEGVSGVYAYNRGEMQIEPELVELLAFCDSLYESTGRRNDPHMGAMLRIWYEYRTQKKGVPPMELLQAAAKDRTKLDLGAVAKGWAVEKAAQLIAPEMPAFLIDAGGNIRTGNSPSDGRRWWTVGIQDPRSTGMLTKLAVANLSVVSSGDYERYFEEGDARYHHIIDPDTLMPGGEFAQVTILTKHSGLADYLSTVVFLLPYEEGRTLVESMEGVEAIWAWGDGTIEMTGGAKLRMTDGV